MSSLKKIEHEMKNNNNNRGEGLALNICCSTFNYSWGIAQLLELEKGFRELLALCIPKKIAYTRNSQLPS